jgi:hypothetical protein
MLDGDTWRLRIYLVRLPVDEMKMVKRAPC